MSENNPRTIMKQRATIKRQSVTSFRKVHKSSPAAENFMPEKRFYYSTKLNAQLK